MSIFSQPEFLEPEVLDINQKIVNYLHTGVAFVTPDGHIRSCNKSFYNLLDLTNNIIGKHSSEVFLTASSGVMTSIHTKKPVVSIGITVNNKRGIAFRFPILNEDGSLQGVLCEALPLPLCPQQTEKLIEAVFQFKENQDQDVPKKHRHDQLHTFADIVGTSSAVQEMKKLGRLFARGNDPILICGESGTGKELTAQALHMASQRAGKAFVTVNCAALPPELMESELFGYESGAFTGARAKGLPGKFEMANGGTIFLDEVGELPLNVQAKFLRTLESGEIQKLAHCGHLYSDFRLICATNQDLDELVKQNKFRTDLYHRINVFEMTIPPLRERLDDLPQLCEHFAAEFQNGSMRSIRLSTEVLSFFCAYSWPGNLRELRNVFRYALCAMNGGTVLKLEHLPRRLLQHHETHYDFGKKSNNHDELRQQNSFDMQGAGHEAEKNVLRKALQTCGNNKTLTASILNISRTRLYAKLRKYGMLDLT